DRFQPELTKAGDEIDPSKSNAEAFLGAWSWTNSFFTPENYGTSWTLRSAIMSKKLDCVRVTDMVGTIFRNAGRSRFGHIRWSSEGGGHSVAAFLGGDNSQPQILIVDGMNMPGEPEIWPNAYFSGHAWPPILANNPTPYAVELYGRGIDSYV